MNYNKLPADPTAMILGIIALIIGVVGCCCYGVFAIIPLIISIIGLVMANNSLKEFAENPEAFSPQSRSNVATGKILNIIAIVFNGIVVLFFIGVLAFYGTLASQGFYDEILNSGRNKDYNAWENDSIYDYSEDDFNIESDSIYRVEIQDSLIIE